MVAINRESAVAISRCAHVVTVADNPAVLAFMMLSAYAQRRASPIGTWPF